MLSVVEGRVLGCLLEKQRTTPDQYPLTMNALILACNQSTAREPTMALEVHDVDAAITSMKAGGLLRIVHPSHGRSVTRYRQVADEAHGWTPAQAALMAVLLLRGPQTVAELRTRCERLHDFTSIEAVEASLSELAALDPPMVVRLDRAIGQKELRWQQLMADEAEPAVRAGPSTNPAASAAAGLAAKVADLEERIARIEAALQELL